VQSRWHSVVMNRTAFLGILGAVASVPASALADHPAGATIAGVLVPDSALAREAMETSLAAGSPQIFKHSLRTFLFAELIAKANRVAHDSELVFIASILHDLGLTVQYMSAHNRFEGDGANAARQLMQRHLMPECATEIVWDAIALHDSGGLAKWKRPEVMLVNAGVGADFGANLELLQRDDVKAVLQGASRDGFVDVFLPAVAAVAAKKPLATGNSFVTDVGYRLVPGFHLPNFCDDVKRDPFTDYL
jgi:HD domain